VRDFQAVLDTDPNNADALSILSNCYLISGRVDRARPLVERFSAVDPLNPLSQALRGYVDMLEGRSETAVAAYREMLEMDPSSPMARLFYGMNLVRAGQLDEAAARPRRVRRRRAGVAWRPPRRVPARCGRRNDPRRSLETRG
jgi:tetratricopeptide (TPR) repeat protein